MILPYGDHDRIAQARVVAQCRLNFSELDPKAANFHLVIGAPQKIDAPVRQEAPAIACTIEPLQRVANCELYENVPQ